MTTIDTSFALVPATNILDDVTQLETSTLDHQRIYVIRHGQSQFNVPDATSGIQQTSGKSHKVPLTTLGEKQASALGVKLHNKFSKEGKFVILSSTALRAQTTADFVLKQMEKDRNIIRGGSYEGFCELGQGTWEGKPKDAAYEAALKPWKQLSAEKKFIVEKISTGESYHEVAKRFQLDLESAIKKYPEHTIIIVAHYAAMNAIALQLSDRIGELSSEAKTPLPEVLLHNCDLLALEVASDVIRTTAHIKSKV